MTIPRPVEAHIERLLRMFAGIEEVIIGLEAGGGDADRLIGHLRLVQDDIASALRRLDDPAGRSEGRPEPPPSPDSHRRLGDSRARGGGARDQQD